MIAPRAGFDVPALDPTDPFAGDDILWAEEDWDHWAADDGSWLTFSYGLTLAVIASAFLWLAIAGSVFFVYRLPTRADCWSPRGARPSIEGFSGAVRA